ncbi:MAG: hypothetical protein R3D30_06910 [Hyphomicrobiales bacterium]
MRLLFAFVLSTYCFVLLANAAPLTLTVGSSPLQAPLVLDAKFVCGDFGNGFTCKREAGADRRSGKAPSIPGSSSDDSYSAPADSSGMQDALPPASGDSGWTSAPPPAAAAASSGCPENSELLGGHCIPFTQRCTAGIPPTAYPPQCQGEEKQVCSFHPDGSKDCCCRVYSKF